MEAGIGEALALILSKEAAISEDDVVDLVSGALSVEAVPFFLGLLPLSGNFCRLHVIKRQIKHEKLIHIMLKLQIIAIQTQDLHEVSRTITLNIEKF